MNDTIRSDLNVQLEKLNKAVQLHEWIVQTIHRRNGPATTPRLCSATEIETASLDILYTAIEAACRRHEIHINNLNCTINWRFRPLSECNELYAFVDRFQTLYHMMSLRMEIRWQ